VTAGCSERGGTLIFGEFLKTTRPFMLRYAAAWVPLALAYLLVFALVRDDTLGGTAWSAFVNIAIPFVLGLPVMALNILVLARSAPLLQLAAHTLASLLFSAAWLQLLVWIGALRRVLRGEAWAPIAFPEGAAVWQLMQGATVYFMIVAGSYVIALLVNQSFLKSGLGPRHFARGAGEIDDGASGEEAAAMSETPAMGRIFLRVDDEFVALDVEDIVCIHGASDYCEIAMRDRTHLVRATLASMAERVGEERFLRVHRSHLVNIKAIANVEPRPNGGFMLIMINGARVPCSRAGAKAIQPLLLS